MSLEAILEAIRLAGEAKLLEIEEQARSQAAEILAEASQGAQQIQKKAWSTAVAPAFQERARIIHKAQLEALKATGATLEELVDTVLDHVRQKLAVIRVDDSYPTILLKLSQEALIELEGSLEEVGQVRLEADERDRSLLEHILGEMRLDLPVSYNLNSWGGLSAKSEDGRVTVINTLEARQERASPFLRQSLASFFEAKTNDVWLRVREYSLARQEIPLAVEAGPGNPGGRG